MQKFISFAIVIVILYFLAQVKLSDFSDVKESNTSAPSQESEIKPNKSDDIKMSGTFIEKTVSNVVNNLLKTEQGRAFFHNVLQPMNSSAISHSGIKVSEIDFISSMLNIDTVVAGKKNLATCGQEVKVEYLVSTLDNQNIIDDSTTLTLGDKKITPGIDAVISGMMLGETRTAVLPPKYGFQESKYTNPNIDISAYYKVQVKLNAISSNVFINPKMVKIFDSEVQYKLPLVCGDKTKFKAKITRLYNGEVIYDSDKVLSNQKIITFVGNQNDPMIFGYALHGNVPCGVRTVIAPSKFFTHLSSSNKRNILLDNKILNSDEYLMLELYDFGDN